MSAGDAVANHWQSYYDHRAADGETAHFMQVLGYHPHSGDDYEGLFNRILADIDRKLQIREGQRFLDIACGFGVFSRHLAHAANWAVGTDLAGGLLREGRALPLPQGARTLDAMVQANAAAQPFRGECFDRILCFGMFFHLNPEAARSVVREIVALLRPGGRALIGDVLDPRRIHFERSYVDRIPTALHLALSHALRMKAAIARWRGKVVYQAFAPRFFSDLLPDGVECEFYERKDDGRRNNASRYDVAIQR